MKVIYWHVYSLEVRHTQKALKSAPDIDLKEKSFNEGVVCLISLERGDDSKQDLFDRFLQDLKNYMQHIGANKVFLYPYAHLSSNLLEPSKSKAMFYELLEFLRKSNIDVDYAEFGWYKEFKVHVRGHPLAELSRVF